MPTRSRTHSPRHNRQKGQLEGTPKLVGTSPQFCHGNFLPHTNWHSRQILSLFLGGQGADPRGSGITPGRCGATYRCPDGARVRHVESQCPAHRATHCPATTTLGPRPSRHPPSCCSQSLLTYHRPPTSAALLCRGALMSPGKGSSGSHSEQGCHRAAWAQATGYPKPPGGLRPLRL